MYPALRALWIGVILILVGSMASIAQSVTARRSAVLLLSFENSTDTPPSSYWRFAIDRVLSEQLHAVRSLRLLNGEKFARRELWIKEGASPSHAQETGEFLRTGC